MRRDARAPIVSCVRYILEIPYAVLSKWEIIGSDLCSPSKQETPHFGVGANPCCKAAALPNRLLGLPHFPNASGCLGPFGNVISGVGGGGGGQDLAKRPWFFFVFSPPNFCVIKGHTWLMYVHVLRSFFKLVLRCRRVVLVACFLIYIKKKNSVVRVQYVYQNIYKLYKF